MKHLILCRELPPAPYPPGGIGVYVQHISRLLAERGEIIHVIGQRWAGAPKRIEHQCGGRLVIHRISPEDLDLYPDWGKCTSAKSVAKAMRSSVFPAQWFSWVAAGLAEKLIEREGIDVIEAQEWEAPLYYLLLRRSLGLAPKNAPPCIVHFHSPTEFIFKHNQWPLSRPDFYPLKRLEDFAILAADAHLCPSAFLAEQCTERYGIAGEIEVIPLPIGTSTRRIRSPETWTSGSIFFSGRLEPRKGIIEFVDAAIAVASENRSLRFDFVGSDNKYNAHLSMMQLLEPRIPPEIRHCFRFHGGKPREELLEMLAKARIAVVPSRWENFPNTCLEALSSGLPVLATRNGGMAEMIEDGVSGWLVSAGPEPLAARLESGLRRALDADPEELASMGEAAARSIGAICDNERIARRHIEYRQKVLRTGTTTNTRFPRSYSWPHRLRRPVATNCAASADQRTVAVIVVALADADPTATLASLDTQGGLDKIVVVSREPPRSHLPHIWQPFVGSSAAAAKNLALERCGDAAYVLVVDAYHMLAAGAIEQLATQLVHNPELGAAGAWTVEADDRVDLRPEQPAFPHQWLRNGLSGPIMYRSEAIAAAGGFCLDIGEGFDEWDLVTRIMAQGWFVVRIPIVMSARDKNWAAWTAAHSQLCHARAQIAARLPALVGEDVIDLLLLHGMPDPYHSRGSEGAGGESGTENAPPQIQTIAQALALPLPEKVALLRLALKKRKAAGQWMVWRMKSVLSRN